MARALLGNGPVNTPSPNTQRNNGRRLSGGILLRVASQQRTNEDAGSESRDLFCVIFLIQQYICVICVWSVQRLYNDSYKYNGLIIVGRPLVREGTPQ
jgi:hypothetical protein